MRRQIPVASWNQTAVAFKFSHKSQDCCFCDAQAPGREVGSPSGELDAPLFAQQERNDVEKRLERELTDDGHVWTVQEMHMILQARKPTQGGEDALSYRTTEAGQET